MTEHFLQKKKKLRSIVNSYEEKGQFEGAVLVAKGTDLLLADGWGFANREWKTKNTVDTRFRLASITKTFTATLIMKLYQEHLLDIDDPIGKYISDLPHIDTITVLAGISIS